VNNNAAPLQGGIAGPSAARRDIRHAAGLPGKAGHGDPAPQQSDIYHGLI
jgi:hypothetical protein